MSLVGTRPPTVDEWEQYELHHRMIGLIVVSACYNSACCTNYMWCYDLCRNG